MQHCPPATFRPQGRWNGERSAFVNPGQDSHSQRAAKLRTPLAALSNVFRDVVAVPKRRKHWKTSIRCPVADLLCCALVQFHVFHYARSWLVVADQDRLEPWPSVLSQQWNEMVVTADFGCLRSLNSGLQNGCVESLKYIMAYRLCVNCSAMCNI